MPDIYHEPKEMNPLISYCGLACDTCPIYIVTREEDPEVRLTKRAEIARQCREHYGLNYETKDITDCDGCRSKGGRLFSGCIGCEIRNCAVQKSIETCAECEQYPCPTLQAFFIKDPSARIRLEEIRSGAS